MDNKDFYKLTLFLVAEQEKLSDNQKLQLAGMLLDGHSEEKDNEGQIVLYTGLMRNDDGEIVPFESDDELDSDYSD